LQGQAAADLDDVVGEHSKANPTLYTFEPSISAAIQSMAPLQHSRQWLEADAYIVSHTTPLVLGGHDRKRDTEGV